MPKLSFRINFFCILAEIFNFLFLAEMEKIIIENTTKTPYIKFDHESGQIELRGRSIMENTSSFYEPLVEWMDEYIEHPYEDGTMVFIDLEYFNSSTSKWLLTLFEKFSSLYRRNHYIIVKLL